MNLGNAIAERFARPVTPQQPAFDPDAFATGRDIQQAVERVGQHPDVQASLELSANGNYRWVQDKYSKEFAKWGAEIQAKLRDVPKRLWSVDTLETVVKLVQADHLTELRAEWQNEARASVEPTMRANGAAGSVPVPEKNKEHSLESEKIPAEWKLRAQQQGITESTVREFCASQGMSEEQFYKQFETPKNQIVAEVPSGR